MQTHPATWTDILISAAPFILLIGFWLYFMKHFRGGKQALYIDRSLAFMERQEQLLERIAGALERLASKG